VRSIADLNVELDVAGVQRSQSEKSKDKETFLAQKAQIHQKKAAPPPKSDPVDIPGKKETWMPYLGKYLAQDLRI